MDAMFHRAGGSSHSPPRPPSLKAFRDDLIGLDGTGGGELACRETPKFRIYYCEKC